MDFNSLGYFQPNEIYIMELVKFIFSELSFNDLFSYIFHFLDIYCNFMVLELVMGPADITFEIICTLNKCSQTSVCIRITWWVCRFSSLSSYPTFWLSTWKVGSENLHFYILFYSEAEGPQISPLSILL